MARDFAEPTDALTLKTDLAPAFEYVDLREDLTANERRTLRARHQPMLVVPLTGPDGTALDVFRVFSRSGSDYKVDFESSRCSCPDDDTDRCKHLKRVSLMLDETPLPAPGEPAAPYWDWFFETVRAVTPLRESLSDDFRLAVVRALGTARKESGDFPRLEV